MKVKDMKKKEVIGRETFDAGNRDKILEGAKTLIKKPEDPQLLVEVRKALKEEKELFMLGDKVVFNNPTPDGSKPTVHTISEIKIILAAKENGGNDITYRLADCEDDWFDLGDIMREKKTT